MKISWYKHKYNPGFCCEILQITNSISLFKTWLEVAFHEVRLISTSILIAPIPHPTC